LRAEPIVTFDNVWSWLQNNPKSRQITKNWSVWNRRIDLPSNAARYFVLKKYAGTSRALIKIGNMPCVIGAQFEETIENIMGKLALEKVPGSRPRPQFAGTSRYRLARGWYTS
jgi:hypothetical protein